MSLIIFIIVVLILLALGLYAVGLIPLPGPPFIKPMIQALLVVLAILVIANKAGVL